MYLIGNERWNCSLHRILLESCSSCEHQTNKFTILLALLGQFWIQIVLSINLIISSKFYRNSYNNGTKNEHTSSHSFCVVLFVVWSGIRHNSTVIKTLACICSLLICYLLDVAVAHMDIDSQSSTWCLKCLLIFTPCSSLDSSIELIW